MSLGSKRVGDQIGWYSVVGLTPNFVLRSVTQALLIGLARKLGIAVRATARKDAQFVKLIEGARLPLPAWLGYLVRDKLRVACCEREIDAPSRSRTELEGAPLDAASLSRDRRHNSTGFRRRRGPGCPASRRHGRGPAPPLFDSGCPQLHRP